MRVQDWRMSLDNHFNFGFVGPSQFWSHNGATKRKLGSLYRGCGRRRDRRVRMVLDSSKAMPIVALSDLHVDHPVNRAIVQDMASRRREEAIVVAGDISHDMDLLEESMKALAKGFLRVFFVCGNHELWVHARRRVDSDATKDSFKKYDEVTALCERLGILCHPHRVGSVVVTPIPSWYDLSLELPVEDALLSGFERWPWTDFSRCVWPEELEDQYACSGGRYPSRVAHYFAAENENAIHASIEELRRQPDALTALSFSHFLPGHFALPDWMEPEADVFSRSWINHRAASIASKFSRVAGSTTIEQQLRRITPHATNHIHCFGHSHRPKDIRRNGVRYVHHPLGKPAERERFMAPPECIPKKILDIEGKPVPAPTVVRYWEQVLKGEVLI